MDYADKIKKLNVLEKLLKQEFISIRKNLGDEKIINEINLEIKEFLSGLMEDTFSGSSRTTQQFSSQNVAILNEIANRLASKVSVSESSGEIITDDPQIEQPENPHINSEDLSVTAARKKGSPILEALKGQGFDPSAPLEERRAAIKKARKGK